MQDSHFNIIKYTAPNALLQKTATNTVSKRSLIDLTETFIQVYKTCDLDD